MRISILSIIILLVSLVGKSMAPEDSGTAPSVALVLYEADSRGLYHKQTNVNVYSMDVTAACYAYDKKAKCLYLSTDYGNYAIRLNDEKAGQVKKDKSIPQLDGEALQDRVAAVSRALDEKFERLNREREQFITDSIADMRERERLAIIEREIERARQDSIHQLAVAQYRSGHKWRWMPVPGTSFTCDYCDKSVTVADSVFVVAIQDGKVFFLRDEYGCLGLNRKVLHGGSMPLSWHDCEATKLHMEAFADSLALAPVISDETVAQMNKEYGQKYLNALVKKAPYGFFIDWDWEESYSMVTFDFSFFNTNKKTIKYIDVYWKITNDVDDVRKTGHFKGTGPVAQYETGSWSWDSSSYFVAGDATTMELTKVIITYMNGTQQTLTKKMIFTETDFTD